MEHHTLYRKHRPSNFNEVFGQESVVKILESFISNGKLPHAYLFIGSRGIGKTSIARIFANSLNIKNEDITEIDAASNRGIDDIRELRDSVYTLPALSDYKLYIIDEAHMLTEQAFNALLKTLEEPPKHCLFILATTEREKVPETIVSRCQQINFQTPTNEIVSKFVIDIAKKEGFDLDKTTAKAISKNARGAFRDALTLLQQLIDTNKDGKIDSKYVNEILGISEPEKVLRVLEFYAKSDEKSLVNEIDEIKKTATKPEIFLDSFIDLFRACMLYRVTKGDIASIEILDIDEKEIAELVKKYPEAFQSKYLIKLLDAYNQVIHSTYPWVYIEAVLLDK